MIPIKKEIRKNGIVIIVKDSFFFGILNWKRIFVRYRIAYGEYKDWVEEPNSRQVRKHVLIKLDEWNESL